MRRAFYEIVTILCLTDITAASTYFDSEETCPLCKTQFRTCVEGSGTIVDLGLDFRPLGFIASPPPVAVCPHCKFVLDSDRIAIGDLEKCERIVASEDYKKHSGRSSYFLLATINEKLGRDDLTVARQFLGASWQETGENQKEDLRLGEKHFRAYLAKTKNHYTSWYRTQLIIGDLLRRQDRFEDARKHCAKLSTMTEFQVREAVEMIAFQQDLITRQDSAEHKQSEMNPPPLEDAGADRVIPNKAAGTVPDKPNRVVPDKPSKTIPERVP